MKIFLSSSFVLLLFFQNCGQPIGEIAIDFSLTESSNSSNIEVIDNTNNEVVDDIDNPDLLPTSDSIAMYSYNSDLSGAQILEGVTLERSVVYLFLTNDDNYKNISFYCCKSLSEGHLPVIKDSSKPFIHRLDMNEFSGGTKELYMDASYVDSTSYDEIYAQFTIKEGEEEVVDVKPPSDTETDLSLSCGDRLNVKEDDLVNSSEDSSKFFRLVDFEGTDKSNMRGGFTDKHCFSGDQGLDSSTTDLTSRHSLGGIVPLPSGKKVAKGEEIWIRFRVFFPKAFKFSSCKKLDLDPGCDNYETNSTVKFIGINYNVYNKGRQWFNFTHEGSSQTYAWVYEPNYGAAKFFDDGIVKGQWETFEYYTKLSNIEGEGIRRVYKNGKLLKESFAKNIADSTMYITSVYLLEYWNGGVPSYESVYFDEIIVTTKTPKKIDEDGNPFLGY